MAGTRGLAQFKGKQLNSGILRDRHFDEMNKIDERFIAINFNAHREVLEDTKIDVFSQVNNKVVASLFEIDVTADIGGKTESTGVTVEGVVTGERVDLRQTGTEDFPLIDNDGDRVYGKLEFTSTPDKYVLKFYSMQPDGLGDQVETPYTFPNDAPNMDFRYCLRTNLSVIPVDAIVRGGAGFVEGATDANAYMNLLQLMKDVYGVSGSLNNDGNSTLGKDILTQIGELVARADKLETNDEEEVYEAIGGETTYNLQNGVAKPKTVIIAFNGQVQAPGVNFEFITNQEGNITGIDIAPDTLEVVNGIPDVLYVRYKKVM